MDEKDIDFLEHLSDRLSWLLYYRSKQIIDKIQHDDYDRLREIVKQERIKYHQRQIEMILTKK